MAFKDLNVEELQSVANFFAVEVEKADEKKSATKAELIAALNAGDDPVTWEQYETIYLEAKADNQLESDEDAEELVERDPVEVEPIDTSNYVLVKYERNNPYFEAVGYAFNKRHPFASVPPEVATHLVRNVGGFRLALPDELADYYN